MNREIKFRAWETEHKFMIPMVYLFSHKMDGCLNYYNYGAQNPELPLMQYTGLKDSKGREIYEGDILKASSTGGHTGVVEFVDGRFIVNFAKGTGNIIWLAIDRAHLDEVIGNIYENPELLEKS